jgi:hypothetical protein
VRVILIIAASLALIVWPGAIAGASRPGRGPERCSTRRGHVLVADQQARVYRAENSLSELEIYGCAYRGHQSYILGPTPECTSSGCGGLEGTPTLAGSVVAYELHNTIARIEASWLVVVRDLRTGRILERLPTGSSTSSEVLGGGPTAGIVVKADGSVAWIVDGGEARGGLHVQVVDKAGSRTIASGMDIAPNSLALVGSTLYWTQGGRPLSATLN